MGQEELARLQRRQEARRAGVDLDRDMCMHDYLNGIGCKDCEEHSRLIILLAVLTVALTFLGVWALLNWFATA